MTRKFALTLGVVALLLTGCASKQTSPEMDNPGEYLQQGSIILSGQVPKVIGPRLALGSKRPMAPVIGYIPPTVGFMPAENETWLQIETKSKTLVLYRGDNEVRRFQAQGSVNIEPGNYALQHKQKRPLWYAPDVYFTKRGLKVPASDDRARYRRGALGQYVIYPTTTFPIHSGPLWTKDVGGLKVARADLSSIYYMLPIGSTIVVK